MKNEIIDAEIYIYAVKDSHGNTDWDATSDSSNTIQICGMKDSEGNPLYFEADAYHLENWCSANKLTIVSSHKEFTILI